MTWSTRELAELGGTSLRTVRHYHDVGLLEEPERGTNGYKHYGPSHLVKLLSIRRLGDLGFSLSQIAEIDGNDHNTVQVLRSLDAQLSQNIDRLEQARLELALLLEDVAPDPELPAELSPITDQPLTGADRTFLTVLSRVVSPTDLASYIDGARMAYADPAFAEFAALPPDATEKVRADLAVEMLPRTLMINTNRPLLNVSKSGSKGSASSAARALTAAIEEAYNPAQIDVLKRLSKATEMAAEGD